MLSEKNKRMAMLLAGIAIAYFVFGIAKTIIYYMIVGAILVYFLDKKKPELTAGIKKKFKNKLDEKISEEIEKTKRSLMA
tara:strand:- start:679 stop:918 length:240 start_codon:yes stop_codon:yes gene_type:complete